jgi:hypothetical protein
LLGANLISTAYAAGNTTINATIRVDSYEEMMQECSFDKTIIEGGSGIFCVKK